jgi:CHAT domain-containing protein/tetratricopeptide (TPR) repeat protein
MFLMGTAVSGQDLDGILDDVGALFQKNEYARAIALLATIPESAPAKPHIRKHLSTAQALMNLGRHTEAPPHIAEARAIAKQAGDIGGEANAEIVEANYRRWLRQRDQSLSASQRAVALAQRAGDRRLLAQAYSRLGQAYREFEDWGQSLYYTEKSFGLLDNPTLTDRFNIAIQRGIARFELYDRDAAEAAFVEGLDLALQTGGKRDQSFALGELGYTYWTFDRDRPRALEHYDRAVQLAIEAATPDLEATWRLNRGNIHRDTGDCAQAIDAYQRVVAIEQAHQLRSVTFAASKNIGQCYLKQGRLEEALALLEPLVRDKPGNPSPRLLWQAHMELASAYEALDRDDEANAQYQAMLEVLEEQRNTAILDSFRTGSFAHTLRAYDPYERYMRFLTRREAEPVSLAEAFRISEKARARGFLEMLASVRSTLAATVPKALLEEEHGIMRGVSGVQQKLRAADLPKTERQALLAELAALERRRDSFRLKLRFEHPALSHARYPEIAGPADLQRVLRPGERVVSFFLGEPDSFRWTITRASVTFHRLPSRAVIDAQVSRVRDVLRAPGDVAAARQEADALSALLLDGLDLRTGGPLVVVPHGALHYIPFDILTHGGRLLIERHAITYAPSLNSLAYLRRTPAPSSDFRVLAVGAPEVRRGVVTAAARSGDVDSLALLGPLPFANEELAAIQRTFPADTEMLSGAAARETALRRADLGEFRILHFATHGLVSESNPSRSGLLFSPEPGEDGLLQMGEIYGLGLKSDLVVLSACQTALGREITGEGIVGLTRAFFYGGSRAVMAALWNLNDRFAADFVERFYTELRAGRSSEEALRHAKLAYIRDGRYAHPYYWSSIILAGDGSRVLYDETSKAWTAAAVSAFALLMILAVRRRRPKA